MLKKFLFTLFLGFLFCNKVFAETKEELRAKYVLSNMQQDYITCYSFYKIGAEYIRKSNGELNIVEGVEKSSDTSLKLAHETGELMGMTLEEMSSKVKNEMKKQLNQIDNDFNNASILLNKYALQCKNLIENKKQRISFWENEAIDKFNE
tara:strand:- start:1259 stop:1708 length:450 start_codon:yes stop_codon:yes gene_type:complete